MGKGTPATMLLRHPLGDKSRRYYEDGDFDGGATSEKVTVGVVEGLSSVFCQGGPSG